MRIQQLLRRLPRIKTKTKKELPTLPAETSIEDPTKEKKVVVVKPGEPDVKISDTAEHSEGVKREENNSGQ